MKECLDQEFLSICEVDIDDLLFDFNEIMKDLKPWQLENSVIACDNFKIMCKEVRNDEKEMVGYNISAKVFLDILYEYEINLRKNSICLEKVYQDSDHLVVENYQVSYDGENVFRTCFYQKDNEVYNFADRFSKNFLLDEKENLSDICKNLKNKSLVNRRGVK